METLQGRVGLVTGASRGIGRAIALRLARAGAAVAINYRNDGERARGVVREIEACGGRALAIQADLARLDEVRGLFEATLDHFGRLDIVVNNAAVACFQPLAEVSEGTFDQIFAVNVKGVFFAMQEAARRLSDGGRIINLSSGITIHGSAGGSVYGGSKGAVEEFTKAAAKELGRRQITVNTVSAGFTETDMFYQAVAPENRAQAVSLSPLGRLGQPEDIAEVVVFLASEGGRWITGQHIRATGGAD
ncbi:MAG TPA: glucose 1-dehydrogenase [Candidatus Binataceae bacterium]|nr:glucose 1-dehydrogenase [Candidatus Binataceae bacterium]